MDPVSIADEVREFYQRHPYPPPVENLDRYRERWNDTQRQRGRGRSQLCRLSLAS